METPLKPLYEQYAKPTPLIWRKVGDAINSLGTTVQVTLAAMQVSETTHIDPREYFYWVIAISITQWLGKTITDFASNGK